MIDFTEYLPFTCRLDWSCWMLEKWLIVTIDDCGEVVLFAFWTLQALNPAQGQPSSTLLSVKCPCL